MQEIPDYNIVVAFRRLAEFLIEHDATLRIERTETGIVSGYIAYVSWIRDTDNLTYTIMGVAPSLGRVVIDIVYRLKSYESTIPTL